MDMHGHGGQNYFGHQGMYSDPYPPIYPPWPPEDHRPNFPDNNFQQQRYHHHQYDHVNGGPMDMFAGQPAPFSGRKRGFIHAADHIDSGCPAKLYVAPIPRTATVEDIHALFDQHGNIVEIVLPKDKKTGQQHGYCFVKYLTFEEADRAIKALHCQYTFPGELASVKVRYADGERERVVALPDKLYVGHLNRQASKREVEEIFSQYGHIEDIYIVRDDMKQSRGCGFVQFSRREMALTAIKELNGVYTMRGSEQPLIVRFADPKKPKNGELRGNYAFGSSAFVPNAQARIRPDPNVGNSVGGNIPSNHVYPMQHFSTNCQPQAGFHWPNHQAAVPSATQPLHFPHEQSHSDFSQVNPPIQCSQLSEQAVGMEKEMRLRHPLSQNSEQTKSEVDGQESPRTRSNPHTDASTAAATAIPQISQTAASLESDWSEHTCPDGYKYYYNCVTCESRWDKPEEYMSFEQQLQKQKKLQDSTQQQSSESAVCSTQEVAETQEEQLQNFHQKLQLEESPKSATEPNLLQVQSEASSVIDPTCI